MPFAEGRSSFRRSLNYDLPQYIDDSLDVAAFGIYGGNSHVTDGVIF